MIATLTFWLMLLMAVIPLCWLLWFELHEHQQQHAVLRNRVVRDLPAIHATSVARSSSKAAFLALVTTPEEDEEPCEAEIATLTGAEIERLLPCRAAHRSEIQAMMDREG